MPEQELQDPLLAAVRNARPAIDDAAVAPTSPDALEVLERVLQGESSGLAPSVDSAPGQRIRGRPRAATRHLLRPRIGAIATAAAAAVAAAVIVLSGISGGPSLVDRAYAAVNPSDQVLHEVDIQNDGPPGYSYRVEGWLLPADGQARVISIWGYKGSPFVSEGIITVTGRVFARVCLSRCRPASFIRSRSRWAPEGRIAPGSFGGVPGTLPGTFANWFRTAYHDHAIAAVGNATFDGKHVARFQSMIPTFASKIVFWRPGTPPPLSARKDRSGAAPYTLIDWYVDPATAQPVGFKASPCAGEEIRSCTRPFSTTRIVTFRRLDPTPQNLALLTGPNAPAGAR
jgi:hypothetical protein